ncbi:reverse transcriptase domain-containing protein [Tanacetum coccineum]
MDVFAWEPTDMTGVPKRIIEHSLNVNPLIEPAAQKRRVLASDRTLVVIKEVEEWVNAGIIRPVRYPTWIANPVLMKKADGSWRMCIDFKNLNSACPKDYYPLLDIDGKIESVGLLTMMVGQAFQSQIGRNLESYIDDLVIKSNDEKMLIADIAETFDNLRKINMKLNPKKCSFGVEEGKFLGHIVTSEGIRANLKKTKAIADMQSPRTLKEMQSLSGKLAALKRFLSSSAEKSLPFFETLKDITKENKDEYRWTESAEKGIPRNEAMHSGATVANHSWTQNKAERNYAPMEKLALSLLHMSRRLQRYFEAHPIKVITDQLLKQILNKTQASRKLAKYSVELGAYNIAYEPRSAIKGHVLADFLSEAPVGTHPEEFFRLPTDVPNQDEVEKWTLFTDGASNNKGSGAGLVLISPSGVEFTYVRDIDAKVDSKLVASQINRSYVASSTSMIKYLATAKECIAGFRSFVIQNIPRNLNQKADILSKLATHAFDHLTKKVLVEVLAERSTDQKEVSAVVEEEEDNWMTPIIRCLAEGVWPEDKEERRALRMKMNQPTTLSERYTWDPAECMSVRGRWWQRPQGRDTTGQPCIGTLEARPKNVTHASPLPQASRKLKFVIVAIDYFTKWIEAKPLARITGKDVKKFIWDNIVCRFGLPRVIVTDNGTQFVNDPFKGWCESLNIKQMNTAVAHPLTYGSEAVIPAEIGMPTHRTMTIKEDKNEDELRLNMDLLQERREAATIREAKYKTKMEQYYNQKVRMTSFKPDEYLFRKNKASRVEDQMEQYHNLHFYIPYDVNDIMLKWSHK